MRYIVVILASLLSFHNLRAEEAATPVPVEETPTEQTTKSPDKQQWRLSIGLYQTSSSKTKYDVSAGSQKLIAWEDKDKSSTGISVDADTFLKDSIVSIGFGAFYNRYKYSDGSPSDGQLAALGFAKVHAIANQVDFWAGAGLGIMNTSIGLLGVTTSTYSLTIDEKNIYSWVATLKAGADYQVSEKLFVGLQAAWVYSEGEANATYRDLSTGGAAGITYELKRSWMTYGARVGFNL